MGCSKGCNYTIIDDDAHEILGSLPGTEPNSSLVTLEGLSCAFPQLTPGSFAITALTWPEYEEVRVFVSRRVKKG